MMPDRLKKYLVKKKPITTVVPVVVHDNKKTFIEYNNITIPVYVSCTSIFQNQHLLFQTLQSIISQTKKPDKIFVYLSEKPYLLDMGFSNKIITHPPLLDLLQHNQPLISVCWVDNEGSFRKLIPLLKKKWHEDCIIITVDDDTVYEKNMIHNMVVDYYKHECVVNYRGFTPKMKTLDDFDYLKRDRLVKKHLYNFSTGKGGVLYKPQFFHDTGQLVFRRDIYNETTQCQDDIWFYLLRILNKIPCFIDNKPYMTKDLPNHGLFATYNIKNNNNTVVYKNLLSKLNL